MLRYQVIRHAQGAGAYVVVRTLAVGRVGRVGQVDKVFLRQFSAQGAQHAQAAHTAVKDPDRGCGLRCAAQGYGPQAMVRGMDLNSPLAMRSFQIAGPVICALVPPASTATVTGMSTTSNS